MVYQVVAPAGSTLIFGGGQFLFLKLLLFFWGV